MSSASEPRAGAGAAVPDFYPLQTFRMGAALVEHGVVVEVVGAPGHAPPQILHSR
ncbi:hypothetical protein [Rothia dentocariosa]|uniref:hypothetical protein n=1 Tax=Rothia dentocariosa TaxID=2047 RepID=UPI00242E2B20|nr:hypothetical protein [Rothia dentocariosa]